MLFGSHSTKLFEMAGSFVIQLWIGIVIVVLQAVLRVILTVALFVVSQVLLCFLTLGTCMLFLLVCCILDRLLLRMLTYCCHRTHAVERR